MSEWSESDDKYTVAETTEMSLTDALSTDCRNCGATLTWRLQPDPDSLRYTAECTSCEEYRYSIRPTKAYVVQTEAGI